MAMTRPGLKGLPEAVPWGLDHGSIVPRPQLSINCPAPLLERLKAAAADQGTTLTAMVLAWLEAGLEGRLDVSRDAPRSELEARLDALEAAVAELQAPALPPPPARSALSPPAADGLITTTDLAKRLGVSRGAINERIRRMGGPSVGMTIDGWRAVGQRQGPKGGPLRWCWKQID